MFSNDDRESSDKSGNHISWWKMPNQSQTKAVCKVGLRHVFFVIVRNSPDIIGNFRFEKVYVIPCVSEKGARKTTDKYGAVW